MTIYKIRPFTDSNSRLLISKAIRTGIEIDGSDNPYIITLNYENDVIFGLGVLISDQFFITAGRLFHRYTRIKFNRIHIKFAMFHGAGPRYKVEDAVINSYHDLDLLLRDVDYAVLRVSYFMHNIFLNLNKVNFIPHMI